jgi:hypothetical protein
MAPGAVAGISLDVNLHGLYNSCHHVGHEMITPPGGSGDEPPAAAIGHGLFPGTSDDHDTVVHL